MVDVTVICASTSYTAPWNWLLRRRHLRPPQQPPRGHLLHHYLLDASSRRAHPCLMPPSRVDMLWRSPGARAATDADPALAIMPLHMAGTSHVPWPHSLDKGEKEEGGPAVVLEGRADFRWLALVVVR